MSTTPRRSSQKAGSSKSARTPLGVFMYKEKIGLLCAIGSGTSATFGYSWSGDGATFEHDEAKVKIAHGLTKHKPSECTDFRFSLVDKHILTYVRTIGMTYYRVVAKMDSLYEWEVVNEEVIETPAASVIVSEAKPNNQFVMYEGGAFVHARTTKRLDRWDEDDQLLFTSRRGMFDEGEIRLAGSFVTDRGIVTLYDALEEIDGRYMVSVGGVIFRSDNPRELTWRADVPLWKSEGTFRRDAPPIPLGCITYKNSAYIFWVSGEDLLIARVQDVGSITHKLHPPLPHFKRHHTNPIMEPFPHHVWESEAVFNPAALVTGGKVHLLYRAVGADGVSRIGHTSSEDGFHFKRHTKHPVFVMNNPRRYTVAREVQRFDPTLYASGGSWGGSEDPRMVAIDGRIYVTFNAFDGWDFIRITSISIDEQDFLARRWKWSDPIIISEPNRINKNWVLFPEKIKGKFAILHSIYPDISVDYVDHLDDLAKGKKVIKSKFAPRVPRKSWDSHVRGAGPPPIRTDKGWLVLYHAIDQTDPDRYKLGAMLLDLKEPTRIIARSRGPLLAPDMWYENDWKPGIVYACGAVVKDETLFIYYGGGDKYICLATAPLQPFVDDLIKDAPTPFARFKKPQS